ncbi:nitrate- and nitrite sensing domain-containing protein [Streptomyces sp. NPDC003023]|uniref:sensor histidine kinase n=1 Tax=Streptomyces sp. NPDC003023 TaxID=3364675 RepID=UPI00367C3412
MNRTEPAGPVTPARRPGRRPPRLRTLLVWLAVVPTVAMGAQAAVTAERLLEQSGQLRTDVATGERTGLRLHELMKALQAERTVTAAVRGGSRVPPGDLRSRREATDRAEAAFRQSVDPGPESERTHRHLHELEDLLDELDAHRDEVDARSGTAKQSFAYYSGAISQMIRNYQEFSHMNDADISYESRPAVAMLSASELVAQEDAILASAGPSRTLDAARFAEFTHAVGAHTFLYETWIVPYLPEADKEAYERITGSAAWRTKARVEEAVLSHHEDTDGGVVLPEEVDAWPAAHQRFTEQLDGLNDDRLRDVLAHADAKAGQLEREVAWLVAAGAAALLIVVAVVVFTTRSVLRRLHSLHERTVTVAEQTLPDVVSRLQRGQPVDAEALPRVTGETDEVGRVSDAFARAVAVSVEGHRQLADERDGFGLFAAGIASRTGNLVSRQLSLTEELQDTFGHDETLLPHLMRSDQLTVGMRRQIENLLILAGGEIPDPHTEPMRIADLLREAAAEVEDFRRIERQPLDEVSVEPRVISQISHLLAELLDNATRFSPPRSKVVIRAELVTDGLSVEIEDRGPRVARETYEEMNARLHSAPPYSVLAQNAHRLGLFVVGHLADQLGARVLLRRSAFGGTSAVVVVPGSHLVRPEQAPKPARQPVVPAPRRVREPLTTPAQGRPDTTAQQDAAPTAAGLPQRRPGEAARAVTATAHGSGPPPLPERVPQSHLVEQLRAPQEPQPAAGPGGADAATPEEVADAWADYEHGTETVEQELRREQP